MKAACLRADLRHLREALLRLEDARIRRVDIYRLPEIRDLRDHFQDRAIRRLPIAATPFTPQQVMYIMRASPPTVAMVALLMSCGGAVRHKELTRRETRMYKEETCYTLWRVPKRGKAMAQATIPRTPTTERVIDKALSPEGILSVAPLRIVNEYLKILAKEGHFPPGRYSSYSLRHAGIAAALRADIPEEDIRKQSAHAADIPITYLRYRNPNQHQQMAVANALLRPALLTTVPDSDGEEDFETS